VSVARSPAPAARGEAGRPAEVVQRREEVPGAAPPLQVAMAAAGTEAGAARAPVDDGTVPGPGR
jgi:hypothetical protein